MLETALPKRSTWMIRPTIVSEVSVGSGIASRTGESSGRPNRISGTPPRQVRRRGPEDVASVERAGDLGAHQVRVLDADRAPNPLLAGDQRQDAVVRSDQQAPLRLDDDRVAVRADPRVDDDDVDGPLGVVRNVLEHRQRRGRHVLRRDLVGDVDDRRAVPDRKDRPLHRPDVRVRGPEVGHEGDDARRHGRFTSSSRTPAGSAGSRGCSGRPGCRCPRRPAEARSGRRRSTRRERSSRSRRGSSP